MNSSWAISSVKMQFARV